MAESRSSSSKSGSTTTSSSSTQNGANGSKSGGAVGVLSNAPELVRSTAAQAVERFPEVAASAQTVARDTQRQLEKMPNQGLLAGTSFSLGLGVGLFMSGANRLLVVLAMAPAAAMAATLLARDEDVTSGA